MEFPKRFHFLYDFFFKFKIFPARIRTQNTDFRGNKKKGRRFVSLDASQGMALSLHTRRQESDRARQSYERWDFFLFKKWIFKNIFIFIKVKYAFIFLEEDKFQSSNTAIPRFSWRLTWLPEDWVNLNYFFILKINEHFSRCGRHQGGHQLRLSEQLWTLCA